MNATLNFDTNEFEVTQPPAKPSKFDFGSNAHSRNWAFEAERGWGNSPDLQGKGWNHTVIESENESTGRFSSREAATTTFRLNLEIDDDTPIFSKVTDYSSYRDQHVIPDFDDIITAEELKDPEEWENRDYRLPLPDIPVNRVKAPYDSVEQYLYTHFELMRNDFLIPLQKAVKAYKEVYNYTKNAQDQGAAMEAASNQQPYRLYEHVSMNISL